MLTFFVYVTAYAVRRGDTLTTMPPLLFNEIGPRSPPSILSPGRPGPQNTTTRKVTPHGRIPLPLEGNKSLCSWVGTPSANWDPNNCSQVDITIGDRLISQSNNCYRYRAIIESILNYSESTLNTQYSAGLFVKDTAGQHEVTALNGANLGFKNRAANTAGSRKLELLGCIHADMFFQDKLMLNGVDIKIKLTCNREAFCLMSNAEDFKLSVLSAALFVKRAPAVRLGHADAMQVANAKYPVDRVQMKVFSLARGSRVCNQENLFLGQLPKIIVIGFVDNAAFSGDVTQNPFNFKHCDINFLALYADGEQIPTKPLQPDFANDNCVREYFNLVETAGKRLKDKPLVVDRKEFARGYTLFAFNLSPDQECTGHYSLIKTGNLRAEIRFALPLPTTVNMIVYAVFDNIVEINMRRQVLYDYS
ncbi:uncharacterized protein F54H12.2-like [Amia ocellicauda]|uniref:uncharacterized protein F54H12.2-like n=1 Tax=Amia ocellicauda TaxID=2972642 RepID=UPI0034644568